MPKKPKKINWEKSTQKQRDDWYKEYEVQCLGSEDNTNDRCGFLKNKFKEWELDGAHILDFPCHDGFVTRGFLGKGCQIIGFDIGTDAIAKSNEVAQQNYPKEKGFIWEYQEASTNKFNWKKYSEEFDLIVCFEFIEHITPADVKKVLKQMQSVAKRGGYITISTPQKSGIYGDKDDNGAHINCYTVERLSEEIFEAIGYQAEFEEDENFIYGWWRK